jgi:hypothetical protein
LYRYTVGPSLSSLEKLGVLSKVGLYKLICMPDLPGLYLG